MDAICVNLLLRKSLKVPLLITDLAKPAATNGHSFLIYHSVSGNLNLELDVPVPLFRRQMKFLAQTGRVIHYNHAIAALQSQNISTPDAFVLTFDDGFVNFYTQVFPILRELHIPAMLFVTTGFVEDGIPYPISGHISSHLNAKPVTWDMLGEMLQSGLVTLGAHTHTHIDLSSGSEDQVIEELAKPKELFRQRLGLKVEHFAYPKALWNQTAENLVVQHYASAVISGGRKATPHQFNPYRIPRIPIRRSDGWLFFRAKMRGALSGEEDLYDGLRKHMRRWLEANGQQ